MQSLGWLLNVVLHKLFYFTNSGIFRILRRVSTILRTSKKVHKVMFFDMSKKIYSESLFNTLYPADTDVLKTSSWRLKKYETSYDQTRLCHGVWQKTFDLRSLEDVQFTAPRRHPIYDVLKTSDLRRPENDFKITSM